MLKENDIAPDFTVVDDQNNKVSLKDFRNKKVVLYFYPKDDTPGCTVEACSFRDNLPDFSKLNVEVLGVSKDDVNNHTKFKNKYQLNFRLLADTNGDVCNAYGVLAEKSMFGKKYMGIVRSTFLIDEKGKIVKIWRNVKVDEHIDNILKTLEK